MVLRLVTLQGAIPTGATRKRFEPMSILPQFIDAIQSRSMNEQLDLRASALAIDEDKLLDKLRLSDFKMSGEGEGY